MNVKILSLSSFLFLNILLSCTGISQSDIVKNMGAWKTEFHENFSNISSKTEPESLFILDGSFLVNQNENGKQLELSGSPVGEFGFMFGSRIRERAMELNFSFFSSKQGRRYPSIAASIGGIRGYRFRWNPATQNILIYNDEVLLTEKNFPWNGDQWWKIRFQVVPLKNSRSLLKLKIWHGDSNEPEAWLIEHQDKFLFKGGKCVIWGYPYAGTPIYFDDIMILSLQK